MTPIEDPASHLKNIRHLDNLAMSYLQLYLQIAGALLAATVVAFAQADEELRIFFLLGCGYFIAFSLGFCIIAALTRMAASQRVSEQSLRLRQTPPEQGRHRTVLATSPQVPLLYFAVIVDAIFFSIGVALLYAGYLGKNLHDRQHSALVGLFVVAVAISLFSVIAGIAIMYCILNPGNWRKRQGV